MKKWRGVLVPLAVLALLYDAMTGSSHTLPSKKIMLEVMTPQGLVRGESVIETEVAEAPWWFPTGTGNRSSGAQHGDAPYVDLGGGRYLFVAIEDPLQSPVWWLFSDRHLDAEGSFKPDSMPYLVAITNVHDAGSARHVAPDGLAEVFGPGYRLQRLTATETAEKASTGALGQKFPDLRRQFMQPSATRTGAAAAKTPRDEAQGLTWYAFEAE